MATTAAELSLNTHFAALEDPRVERTRLHHLLDIVTIALCAMMCGADTWVETWGVWPGERGVVHHLSGVAAGDPHA